MFYILLFSLLAVLLVVAGVTAMSRNRERMDSETTTHGPDRSARRNRKAQRAQSRTARRKRH